MLGLKLGVDDYLVKPFEPVELLARMEALLRRASRNHCMSEADTYEFGRVRLDLLREQVSLDDVVLPMLPLEYKLLCYFVQHRNLTLSRARQRLA